jgi:TolB-like protein/DNA-binding winged helix-turn-helix (wHTH) protein/thioredoxin-like negative regulator of GroEL
MENGNGHHKNFVFGEFNLETELQTIRRDGEEIHLAIRPFQVLLFLIENRERVVRRDELLGKFWDGHDVYDDALRKCVGAIRKSLNDLGKSPRFIETRRGSGYRFVGAIEEKKNKIAALTRGYGDTAMYEQTAPADRFFEKRKSPELQNTENEKQAPRLKFISRAIFVSILAVCLISFVALAFFVNLRPAKNSEAKTLFETVAAKHSIAILPLNNLTGDAANDYLSDGITESLINEVSRIESLKVISRNSAFQFKNKDVSAQEIGEKLGVETILEGSLRQSGEQLRVEVRLVNTKDGSVIWVSDSERKKLADIFTIQDGIVCQIVTELKVKLCGETAPASRYTQNVRAYQLYLQGLYCRNQLDKANLEKAIGYFDEALKIDRNYALAHEGLAGVYAVMEFNSLVPPGTVAPLAESHAQKALELDNDLAGAYIVLGEVRTMKNYDLKTRENYYNQALLKNPNHRTAHLWLANNFTVQGKFEEAEREILRAQELDPLSSGVRLHLSELYYYWRKPDKAIEQAELMLAASPENLGAYSLLAKAYAQKGEFEKALASIEKNPTDETNRALVLALAGRADETRKTIEDFAKSDGGNKNPYWAACLFAAIGDKETALAWLEKSYDARQADLVSMKIDPMLDGLRDDARFQDLLRRVHPVE